MNIHVLSNLAMFTMLDITNLAEVNGGMVQEQ